MDAFLAHNKYKFSIPTINEVYETTKKYGEPNEVIPRDWYSL